MSEEGLQQSGQNGAGEQGQNDVNKTDEVKELETNGQKAEQKPNFFEAAYRKALEERVRQREQAEKREREKEIKKEKESGQTAGSKKIEEDHVNITPKRIQAQLYKQWEAASVGGAVEFVEEDVDDIIVDRVDGKVIITLPKDPNKITSMKQILTATAEIAKDLDGSQKSRTERYAQNLKDTAILLAQQRTKQGTALFDTEVVEELYNTAVKMEAALQGKNPEEVLEYNWKQIEQEHIIAPINRIEPKKEQEDKQLGLYEERTQERVKAVVMFALGKKELIIPGEEPGLYEKWYESLKRRGGYTVVVEEGRTYTDADGIQHKEENKVEKQKIETHADFEKYIMDNLQKALVVIALAVNKSEKTKQKIGQSLHQQEEESILSALSKKGEHEQSKLHGYTDTLKFSHKTGQYVDSLAKTMVPPTKLQERVAEKVNVLPAMDVQSQIIAIQEAVYEIYKESKDNPTLRNYAPILALQDDNGEFACTIRSKVLQKIIAAHFGDSYIQLGTSELGHMALLLVDKQSVLDKKPKGYLVATGGEDYRVLEIQDDKVAEAFLQPIVDAILANPEYINVHKEFTLKGREKEKRYITVSTFADAYESNVWVNLAAAKREHSNIEGEELTAGMQLEYAQRAALLDPKNPNPWRLIAQITKDDPTKQEWHRTALQKVHVLVPDITDERILLEDATVNTPAAVIDSFIDKFANIDPVSGRSQSLNIDSTELKRIFDKYKLHEKAIARKEGAIEIEEKDLRDAYLEYVGIRDSVTFSDNDKEFIKALQEELKRRNEEQIKYRGNQENAQYFRQGVKEEDIETFKIIEKVVEKYKTGVNQNKVVEVNAETTEAVYLLNKLINKYTPNGNEFPQILLEFAGEFDESREALINRILFSPYIDEVAGYDLNTLVTEPRLESLLQSFRTEAARVRSTDSKAADRYMQLYKQFRKFKPGVRLFYSMNQTIVTGNIQDLTKYSSALTKDQFINYTKVVPAFGLAMSLFEEEFIKKQAQVRVLRSTDLEDIANNVQARLRAQSKQGLIRSAFEDRRENTKYKDLTNAAGNFEMDEWEVDRAFYVGRTLFHVFLRSGAHLAVGDLPTGVDLSNSPPEDAIANTMNFWGNVLERWDIGLEQGGPEFSADFYQEWSDVMTEMGYSIGESSIYRIGGVRVDNMRKAQWSLINDFLTAWRVASPAFPSIYMDNGQNLKEYLDPRLEKFKKLYDDAAKGGRAGKEAEETLTEELKKIVDNTGLGLGPLLMYNPFWGSNPKYGYDGRRFLWEKVARDNVPLMADLLTGLEFSEKNDNGSTKLDKDGKPIMKPARSENIQTLEEILDNTEYITVTQRDASGKPTEWKFTDKWTGSEEMSKRGEYGLREKLEFLRRLYEIDQMNKAPERDPRKGGTPLKKPDTPPGMIITGIEEAAIVTMIKDNGNKLAKQLADVPWNSVPFLDIPFQYLQFDRFGSDEYDRKIKDTSSEAQVGNKVYTQLKNPGGIDEKELFEILTTVRAGMEDPEGSFQASKRTGALGRTKAKWDLARGIAQWGPVQLIGKGLKIAKLSKSQKVAGPDADALIKVEASARINAMQKAGHFSKKDAKALKKKLRLTWPWLLLAFLQDVGIFTPAMLMKLFGEELGVGEQRG